MKINNLIKIAIGIVILIALIFVLRPSAEVSNVEGVNTTSGLAKAIGKNELIVGIDEAFPPITFKDIDGEYRGIDIDLAKEVEKRTGVKMIFKSIEWENIIPSLMTKDIDIIFSGMGVTDERREMVDFAVYSRSPKGKAFVLGSSNINNKDDLWGRIIAVQSGSYQETDLKEGKIIPIGSWKEIRSISTLPEAIIDLRLGRVDVIISGEDPAAYYIEKTLNASNEFRSIDVGYGIGESGVAFRKEDSKIREEFKKVIDEIILDGTAGQITLEWLGIDKYENWEE